MLLLLCIVSACTSYDEEPDLVSVSVRLVYPDGSPQGAYAGARVELTNANASTFVDSTNADGVATFQVPGGLYNAVSSETYVDTTAAIHYRYIFNGRRDQFVISPDSANLISIELTMTRRRVWY